MKNTFFLLLSLFVFQSCLNSEDKEVSTQNTELEKQTTKKQSILQPFVGNYYFFEKEYLEGELFLVDTTIVRVEISDTYFNKLSKKRDVTALLLSIENYENDGEKWELYGKFQDNVVFVAGKNGYEKIKGTMVLQADSTFVAEFDMLSRGSNEAFKAHEKMYPDKYEDKDYPQTHFFNQHITTQRKGTLQKMAKELK